MSGLSIPTDYAGLRKMAGEFIKALPDLNIEQADNGMKCFGLAYLGCKFPDDVLGRCNRDAGAPALLRIVSREYMTREIELMSQQRIPE